MKTLEEIFIKEQPTELELEVEAVSKSIETIKEDISVIPEIQKDIEDIKEKVSEDIEPIIEAKVSEVIKTIKPKDGKPGAKGKDGKDYVLTDLDKDEIASLIEVPIVEKVIEKTETVKEIPQEIVGEEIVSKINDLEITPELQIDAKHIKNLPKIENGKFIYGNSSGVKELVAGTNITVDNTNLGYPVISATGGLNESFETVSKNLRAYPYTITYSSGDINTITYDLGGGMQIIKTFGYTSGDVTSITLSDDTPNGISLVKTISYVGGAVDNVVYL